MQLGVLGKVSVASVAVLCLSVRATAVLAGNWTFTDVTAYAELTYTHGYGPGSFTERMMIAGGVAAGDYDGDGWVDLFVVQGDTGPNRLYRNQGASGKFREKGVEAGIAGSPEHMNCGGIFSDIDGDGWLDLIVGGIEEFPARVFHNNGNGSFEDVTATSGFAYPEDEFSFALGDVDGDRDLDLAVAHWVPIQDVNPLIPGFNPTLTLWRNDGTGVFTDVTVVSDIDEVTAFAFTPIFADITDDGWLDLVVAGDFGTSAVLFNDGDGTFTQNHASPITDENGMGASVGDYDNDGLLDWMVTSIWDPDQDPEGNWGITGNRLYRGLGAGLFQDATDTAQVREGYWGWGSCLQDFNNDGLLDVFHVNGFPDFSAQEFHEDPARMFINQGNGSFEERSTELGIDDTGDGRGVVCFDYDRDGDIDIFIANNSQPPKLYRNDGGNAGNFLAVRLAGRPPNTEGVGARIHVTTGGVTQMRELRAGSNYASSDPVAAHFGLGAAVVADLVRVEWPDGTATTLTNVPAGQFVTIAAEATPPPGVPDGRLTTSPMTVDKLDPAGAGLSIAWDMTSCTEAVDNHIVFGGGSGLPSSPGGPYAPIGGACEIGTVSPYAWTDAPDTAIDPGGLVWFTLVSNDGARTEGPWGGDSAGVERTGPGAGGASAECNVIVKTLANGCGR